MGEMREILRRNIEKYIAASGLSQKEVAESLGISKSSVTNWIKGKNSPDVDLVRPLCNLLDITIMDLYTDENDPAPIQKTAPLYSSEALKLANDYDNKMGDWGRETVRKVADIEIARYNDEGQAKAKVVKLPLETDVLKIAGRDGSFREILLTDELRKELHEYLDRLQLQDASDIL